MKKKSRTACDIERIGSAVGVRSIIYLYVDIQKLENSFAASVTFAKYFSVG